MLSEWSFHVIFLDVVLEVLSMEFGVPFRLALLAGDAGAYSKSRGGISAPVAFPSRSVEGGVLACFHELFGWSSDPRHQCHWSRRSREGPTPETEHLCGLDL